MSDLHERFMFDHERWEAEQRALITRDRGGLRHALAAWLLASPAFRRWLARDRDPEARIGDEDIAALEEWYRHE